MKINASYNEKKKVKEYFLELNEESKDSYKVFKYIDKKLRKKLRLKRKEKIIGIYSIIYRYLLLNTSIYMAYDESYGIFFSIDGKNNEALLECFIEKLAKII